MRASASVRDRAGVPVDSLLPSSYCPVAERRLPVWIRGMSFLNLSGVPIGETVWFSILVRSLFSGLTPQASGLADMSISFAAGTSRTTGELLWMWCMFSWSDEARDSGLSLGFEAFSSSEVRERWASTGLGFVSDLSRTALPSLSAARGLRGLSRLYCGSRDTWKVLLADIFSGGSAPFLRGAATFPPSFLFLIVSHKLFWSTHTTNKRNTRSEILLGSNLLQIVSLRLIYQLRCYILVELMDFHPPPPHTFFNNTKLGTL